MKYEIKQGGNWFEGNYKPGDILHFAAGNYTYFSGANTNGTIDNPIICLFDAGVIFSNGINLTNCSYWKFDGGSNKNLVIKNAPGAALSFKGKCNGIEITGVKIDTAYSFLWFKTEVNDFNTWDYWKKNGTGGIEASFIMEGLTVTNFEFLNGGFDGGYVGSTGQKADRPVTIDGITYYPYPAKVSNIKFENGTLNGAARTGIQISGLINGGSYLKNVTIQNCGKSQESYQGACFRLGGNSSGGIEIDNCVFDGSHLYAVQSQGGGLIKFTNNTVKNACIVDGITNTEKMAAVEFDTFENTPATLNISGNKIGPSNNGVSVVIYGNPKSIIGPNIFSNNTCEGLFQNFSNVNFDTSDNSTTTPPPPPVASIDHFTLNSDAKTATFYRTDGTTLLYESVDRCIGNNTKKTWSVVFINGLTQQVK